MITRRNFLGTTAIIGAAGTAILMATHNLELIRRQEFRTVEMNRGAVVFDSADQAPTTAPEL